MEFALSGLRGQAPTGAASQDDLAGEDPHQRAFPPPQREEPFGQGGSSSGEPRRGRSLSGGARRGSLHSSVGTSLVLSCCNFQWWVLAMTL